MCVLTLCVSSRLMSFGRHSSVVACQNFSGFLRVLKSQNSLGFSFLFFLVSFSLFLYLPYKHTSPSTENSGFRQSRRTKASSEHLLKLKHTHISMNSSVLLSLQAKLQHSLFPTANNVGINPKKMSEAITK